MEQFIFVRKFCYADNIQGLIESIKEIRIDFLSRKNSSDLLVMADQAIGFIRIRLSTEEIGRRLLRDITEMFIFLKRLQLQIN